MVAGFRPQKDQDTIIRALKYLPDNFHLFLVGDGERRDVLKELVEKENLNDRVHFWGIRNDVPSLLKASDYIIMSSHYEGLSLSSLEGMCVGKPFFASDVDGLREVVNGAGILFTHEDSLALAEKILSLENNKEKCLQIAVYCFQKVVLFDINKMTSQYRNVYI